MRTARRRRPKARFLGATQVCEWRQPPPRQGPSGRNGAAAGVSGTCHPRGGGRGRHLPAHSRGSGGGGDGGSDLKGGDTGSGGAAAATLAAHHLSFRRCARLAGRHARGGVARPAAPAAAGGDGERRERWRARRAAPNGAERRALLRTGHRQWRGPHGHRPRWWPPPAPPPQTSRGRSPGKASRGRSPRMERRSRSPRTAQQLTADTTRGVSRPLPTHGASRRVSSSRTGNSSAHGTAVSQRSILQSFTILVASRRLSRFATGTSQQLLNMISRSTREFFSREESRAGQRQKPQNSS